MTYLRDPGRRVFMFMGFMKDLHHFMLYLLIVLFLFACGGGGDSVSQGTLSTSLTDTSTNEYQAIYVTIDRVEVHMGGNDNGNWQTVANPEKTYNLLELVNGVRETLGIATLNAGHYTQMRLIIGKTPDQDLNIFSTQHPFANYFVDQNNEINELKIPSGMNTGVKVVNGFNINENQTTELLLDFNAMHSVVKAGSSGKYLLKPTVKVLDTADYAIVSGVVAETGTNPQVLLEGALVTAQFSVASDDAKDQIVIDAGTVSDENGSYALFLEPNDPSEFYNLVATLPNYQPVCTPVSLDADSITEINFDLPVVSTNPGTVAGLVTITNAGEDQFATIELRQQVACPSVTETVTVNSFNIANGGFYSVELPAGIYQMVAWSYGMVTSTYDITIISGIQTPLNITLNPTP